MQINPINASEMFVTQLKSLGSQSIASGSTYNWQVTPDTVSGYVPLAVVGFDTQTTSANHAVLNCRLNGSGKAELTIRNNGGSSISVNPRVTILYIRG